MRSIESTWKLAPLAHAKPNPNSNLLPFDLRTNVCRGPARGYYIYQIWCRLLKPFPFWNTDKPTDDKTDGTDHRPTPLL